MTTPKAVDDLIDKCAELQIKLGIDDKQWKELLGNDKGLYGVVEKLLDTATREARQSERAWAYKEYA